MYQSMKMVIAKMLLNCFACYKQYDWWKQLFIISLYIHDIRLLTCDP